LNLEDQDEGGQREVKDATANRERYSHICHTVSLFLVPKAERIIYVYYMHSPVPYEFL
jgi:hypothetical protein